MVPILVIIRMILAKTLHHRLCARLLHGLHFCFGYTVQHKARLGLMLSK